MSYLLGSSRLSSGVAYLRVQKEPEPLKEWQHGAHSMGRIQRSLEDIIRLLCALCRDCFDDRLWRGT